MKAVYEQYSAEQILKFYSQKKENFWFERQAELNFELFRRAAAEVPAYKKFIKQSGINPKDIKGPEGLRLVPSVSKKTYFKAFDFKEMTWPKSIAKESLVMTATSGSTGAPTYFFRGHGVDWQYSVLAEFFYNNGKPGSTLVVNCFSMGVWIGGVLTYQAFRLAGLRGLPISIIAPGINKKEIFNSLRALMPSFDNVVLTGYPPFLKDIIDEAKSEGIDFKKTNLRLLFAAESFTENFRDYVKSAGHIDNIYKDTLNIYGTAELGAMAFETPTSILVRRMALKHPRIYEKLFDGQKKIPTLAQYNPMFASFEEQNGRILITANSVAPFIRYDIGDNGGVLSFSEIEAAFSQSNIDIRAEAKKHGIEITELPFVYVYERSDFSTTLYGLQIYPQTIKLALEQKQLQPFLTGKFTLVQAYDKTRDQYLEINIEMKPKVKINAAIKKAAEQAIIEMLLKHNSEYRELTKMLSQKRTRPRLVFWSYNHENHFTSGIKQKWLKVMPAALAK